MGAYSRNPRYNVITTRLTDAEFDSLCEFMKQKGCLNLAQAARLKMGFKDK